MDPIIVGIDVGLESLTAAVVDAHAAGLVDPTDYANTTEGHSRLFADLNSYEAESLLFCVENTGVYGDAFCYLAKERGYRVALVDPLHVSRSVRDRGHKTDKLDSRKIAEYGARYLDKLRLWEPNEAVIEQIRVLLRTREQLVKQRTASKNMLTSLKRKYIQTPSANQALVKTIEHLKVQIKHIEGEIGRLIRVHPALAQGATLALSLKGVGLLLAAHVAVLTHGFKIEPSYHKLAAYLGIAPRPYVSGKSVRRRPRSRQHGPAMMRKLLHLSAKSLIQSSPYYKSYYLRKQAEGKPIKLILNNIANKQLRILCALLRDQMPYSKNYRSINPRLLQTT